jgi:predicted nucleic acid-binding protein
MVGRINRSVALAFLNQVDENALTTVIRVTEDDDERARQIIRRYDDKDFALPDALSFAVMERLGISHALSLDHHFAQYGWVILPTPE